MKILKFLMIYLNMIIRKKEKYKHYYKREFKTGNCYDTFSRGFEIVNRMTYKVVLRRGEYTNTLNLRYCKWYTINVKFIKNV